MANRGRRAARPKTGGCKSLGMKDIDSRAYVRSAKGKSAQCLVTRTSKSGKKVIVRGSNGLAIHKPSCTLANKKLVKVKKVTFCSTRTMDSKAKRKAAAAKRRAATPRTASATACISKTTGNETIPKLKRCLQEGQRQGATTTAPEARQLPLQKGRKVRRQAQERKVPRRREDGRGQEARSGQPSQGQRELRVPEQEHQEVHPPHGQRTVPPGQQEDPHLANG